MWKKCAYRLFQLLGWTAFFVFFVAACLAANDPEMAAQRQKAKDESAAKRVITESGHDYVHSANCRNCGGM